MSGHFRSTEVTNLNQDLTPVALRCCREARWPGCIRRSGRIGRIIGKSKKQELIGRLTAGVQGRRAGDSAPCLGDGGG